MNYNIGDRLVIELITNEIYEGDYVTGSESRIEIKNIFENRSRNNLGDQVLTFYKSEISAVRLLVPAVNGIDENPTQCDDENIIKLSETEYNVLKQLTRDYKYVTCVDVNYYNAVDDLCNCENIAVVGLNCKPGRASKLDLLVFATWGQVYIFDLLLFDKKCLPKELRQIITNASIRKIVHDGRGLNDCLLHCYDVRMENIFDTQVADVMIEKQINESQLANVRNLGECYKSHFNFPDHIFKSALNINPNLWHKRPLNDGTKHSASLLAAYLFTLKNHLEKLLLKDFLTNVNAYNSSTLKKSAVEANVILNSTDIDEVMSDLKIV